MEMISNIIMGLFVNCSKMRKVHIEDNKNFSQEATFYVLQTPTLQKTSIYAIDENLLKLTTITRVWLFLTVFPDEAVLANAVVRTIRVLANPTVFAWIIFQTFVNVLKKMKLLS